MLQRVFEASLEYNLELHQVTNRFRSRENNRIEKMVILFFSAYYHPMNKNLILLGSFLMAFHANAFISGSVTAPPGKTDVELKAEFQRGTLGPQNLPETQQTQKASITSYQINLGHNFGEVIGLSDFSLHASGLFFSSAEESLNQVIRYGEDSGTVIGLEAANFVHDADRAVGLFLRYAAPVEMNLAKFMNPKVDTVAVGIQSGFNITETFGHESLIYWGSGVFRDGTRHQNASIAISQLFSARFPDLIASGLTVKLGPFLEGDVTERDDLAYRTVGLRSFRVGATALAALRFTSEWGVETGYIQKLSGAYFRATKDFFLSTKIFF